MLLLDPPPVVGAADEEDTVDGLRVLEHRDGVTVVALDDENLLQGLVDLQCHLSPVLAGGPRTLVVDLRGVRLLSSATIGVLLRTRRRCRARGGQVVLRGLSRRSRDVLRRTGLSPLFDTASTPAPAVSR